MTHGMMVSLVVLTTDEKIKKEEKRKLNAVVAAV